MPLTNTQFNSIITLLREVAYESYVFGRAHLEGENASSFLDASWLTESALKNRLREALNK